MFEKKVLHQLSAYKQGMQIAEVKKKYNLRKIVKLASNENPYGFSQKVTESLQYMEKDFELYPDGYAYELRKKVAQKYNLKMDQIVFGAGSEELITFICRAFLSEGTNTVVTNPTFPQYRHYAMIEGATVKEIPSVDGKHDLTKMADAI